MQLFPLWSEFPFWQRSQRRRTAVGPMHAHYKVMWWAIYAVGTKPLLPAPTSTSTPKKAARERGFFRGVGWVVGVPTHLLRRGIYAEGVPSPQAAWKNFKSFNTKNQGHTGIYPDLERPKDEWLGSMLAAQQLKTGASFSFTVNGNFFFFREDPLKDSIQCY